MTKFVRTANKNDLFEGSVLIYGDQEIMLYTDMGDGSFSSMHKGILVTVHPSVIDRFQVEIKPLREVK